MTGREPNWPTWDALCLANAMIFHKDHVEFSYKSHERQCEDLSNFMQTEHQLAYTGPQINAKINNLKTRFRLDLLLEEKSEYCIFKLL